MLNYPIEMQWSDEDQVYVVSLPEREDLVHTLRQTYEEALERGKELLEALIVTRRSAGQTLPEPRVYAASA